MCEYDLALNVLRSNYRPANERCENQSCGRDLDTQEPCFCVMTLAPRMETIVCRSCAEAHLKELERNE